LSSETELNRTQLNGLLSIGSGKPIQSKPKARPSKQVFLVLFYNLFNNRNPIYKLSTAVKRTEQNRTEQSYHYSRGRIPKLLYPFLFWLTYNCGKTTPRVTFMQKYKQITNRDTGNGIQQMGDYEKYLTNDIHDSLKFILNN